LTKPSEPRILIWDLECTGLKADFGTTLVTGYKWLGEKRIYTPSITDYKTFDSDPTDDRQLVKDFIDIFNEADMTVTYFGTGFDRKWLNAKVMEYDLGVLPNTPMVDLFYTVKANMAISRKSLQNVGYFLGLSTEKTPVEGKVWRRASAGHRPSIKYIKDHCRADVAILEEAYLKLRPWVRQHPRLHATASFCRNCGSDHLQSRGRAMTTLVGPRRRLQCQDCGAWMTVTAK
jgi:uncharacterized protein YprB with RNaseH-like and TPR domain